MSTRGNPQDLMKQPFFGASVIVFLGPDVLVKLRDDVAGIACPNMWDFPGGQAEAGETPQETAIRETYEEFHLKLMPRDLRWGRRYPTVSHRGKWVWFFAAHLDGARVGEVILGDEGQAWQLMSPREFMGHAKAIPHFKDRLRDYMDTMKNMEL